MERVIVTGPTGEVGIALVNELISHNVKVIAVVRPGSARVNRLPKSADLMIIENELDKMDELEEKITEKSDVFYHLAWDYSRDHDNVEKQYRNIQYTIDAVKVASKMGCARFVGAGSQAEYGVREDLIAPETPAFPVTAYGIAKLCAGQLSRKLSGQLGIEHVWPRIFSVYGPCDAESTMVISVIRKLLKGEKPSLTKGEQLWDFLYSKDCAKALRLIGEKGHDGAIYCVGRGEKKPLVEFIETIRDEIDPNLPLGVGEIPYRNNQVMELNVDVSSLVRDTGFIPEYDFKTGIRETIQWCRENKQIYKHEEVGQNETFCASENHN